MNYTPDHHLNVVFDFDGEYSAPDALNVVIDFDDQGGISAQYLSPAPLDSLSIGDVRIATAAWTINLSGFSNQRLGNATIDYLNRSIHPTSLNTFLSGQAQIENTARVLKPSGRALTLFGNFSIKSDRAVIQASGLGSFSSGRPRISYALQSVQVVQKNPFSLYGRPSATHGVRYVEQTNAPLFTRYGTAWLSHSPRYIEPRGIFEMFPSRHQIGKSRSIQMEGFDALRFGTRIIPESQTVYPFGFSTLFGETKIENHRQYVFHKGFLTYGTEPQHRFGYGEVWNSDQYLKPASSDFQRFSDQLNIYNRNRYVQTHGQPQTLFGYQRLDNNARLVSPNGIPSPIEVNKSNTMVAHRIRSFRMEGIEPPYITTRHIAHLGARVIVPQGNAFTLCGQPALVNTRRYYNYIGLGIQSDFGKPMIADAVRHLKLQSDYAIQPPVIPMPAVIHGQRNVEMIGLDSVRYGNAYIVSRWNTAMPRWTHVDRVGEPVVRNVTPEIRMWGLLDDLYGKPYIGHYTRYVQAGGLNAQIFGRLRISDSKQFIDLTGFGLLSQNINRLHEIKRLQTDDYLPHQIQPHVLDLNIDKFGKPSIHHNVIRPAAEKAMTLYGDTRITANTIRVEPGYWEIMMGQPRVELANRNVNVAAGRDFMAFGMPRMSPHTIYAVMEAPDQAIANHVRPPMDLHYVDGYSSNGRPRDPGVEFGMPSVTHKQRFILAEGNILSIFGLQRIINAQEIISLRGLNSLRMGVLGPIGDQAIRFRQQDMHSTYGNHAVRHRDELDNRIRPGGMQLVLFGRPYIDHFHREVKPQGFFSQAMGTRKDGDQPYMWQGFRVGAHVPTRVGGDIHSIFGTTWISYRVREVKAGGEDFALVNEYDPYNFQRRMFVWNRIQPQLPAAQRIIGQGFLSQLIGTPNIKPGVHYIRPDGNTDHYRKGVH